jgi:hypothetical protein
MGFPFLGGLGVFIAANLAEHAKNTKAFATRQVRGAT